VYTNKQSPVHCQLETRLYSLKLWHRGLKSVGKKVAIVAKLEIMGTQSFN